jgi:Holliday junction resolvase-like predicted endonuclease
MFAGCHACAGLAGGENVAGRGLAGASTDGRRGEEDAYFYLRRCGYTIISRNFRSPKHRGELDLVGWDQDVLCFVEVRTRTSRDFKPAKAAVDHDKRRQLIMVARNLLRPMSVRRDRGSTCSPYTMSTVTACPRLSCFKMRFLCRTIETSRTALKGFSTCLN